MNPHLAQTPASLKLARRLMNTFVPSDRASRHLRFL